MVNHNNATRRVIYALGGSQQVCAALKISRVAICNWIRQDKIPPEAAYRLYRFARSKGLAVTLDDLFHSYAEPQDGDTLLTTSEQVIKSIMGREKSK